MAQRGYLGIHAEVPTAQCLRSACVVNGAPRSKARRGGLIADLSPRPYPNPIVGASLPAMVVAQFASFADRPSHSTLA
ncbi:hypothetical protein AB7M32_000755 [Pseudomonas sp. R151218B TE3479]